MENKELISTELTGKVALVTGGTRGGFTVLTNEHWENDLQLNLLPPVRVNREVIPGMLEKNSGVMPSWESFGAYAAAKAALINYSRNLSKYLPQKAFAC